MDDKYLVTQANALINSRHNLITAELKVIITLVSMIQPNDEGFKLYKFKITEFMELLKLTGHSKYNDMQMITKSLTEKGIQIREEKRTLQTTWLASADYKHGEGIVELELSQKLKPYLLELKELFTTYRLDNILQLDSKYSIRFYEILKANEYKKTVIIKLSELMQMFALNKTYLIYQNLKKRVIEQAQTEINNKTDIAFDYVPIKTGKKVIALNFTIKPNPKNKPKQLPQEPPKQLKEHNNDTQPNQPDDIKTIQAEFKRLYKGELVDKFVKEMLEKKGLAHVQERLRIYQDYIKGQNIRNIGGHFKTFVMEDYAKPVQHNGNKLQRDNFEQREYSREELEKYYYDFSDVDYREERKGEPKNYTYIED